VRQHPVKSAFALVEGTLYIKPASCQYQVLHFKLLLSLILYRIYERKLS